MKRLLLSIFLIGIVSISGCVSQTIEKTKYVCPDGTTIVDDPNLCPKTNLPQAPSTTCVENWSCTNWTTCTSAGTQTRTCLDNNNCNTFKNKPIELQSCIYSKPFDKFELKTLMEKDYTCGGYCVHLDKVSSIKYSDGILYIEQGGTFVIPNNQDIYNELQGRAKVIADYFGNISEKPSSVQLKEIITEEFADYGFKIVSSKTPANCYSSDNPAICFPSVIYYSESSWDKFLSFSNMEMSYSEWLSITSVNVG